MAVRSRTAGLGRTPDERVDNLVGLLDASTGSGGYHLYVNVLSCETEELPIAQLRSHELIPLRTGAVGSVRSWELVTAVDGPGTRLTVFLSGCPLRCQ